MLGTLIQLLRELEYQYLSTNGLDNFLFLFLAIREALVPLTNNPIKHLKHQNLSIGDDFYLKLQNSFQCYFKSPGRQWCHLQMILSCLGDQYDGYFIWYYNVTSIQSFKQLEHQNLSSKAEIFFQFHFWLPGGQWSHLQMILSCRALRYGCSDTSKTKNVFTGDDPINSSGIFFYFYFL